MNVYLSSAELSVMPEGQKLWLCEKRGQSIAKEKAIIKRKDKARKDRLDLDVFRGGPHSDRLVWSLTRHAPMKGGGASTNNSFWLLVRD